MPLPRVPVNPLQGPAPLTPRATPVDTFHQADVAPLNQGPDEMAQLMSALGGVAPALFRAGDLQHAEETDKQLSEGEQAILADKKLQNRKALRDAVASGQLPAAKNPWFYQGMRQQVYRIEGEKFDSALRDAYAQSDSRNEGDISDFLGGFTSKYMEGIGADPTDPEVARILTPAVERSQAHLLEVHRSEREQAIQQTVEQNTGVEIGQILDHMDESGAESNPEFYAKTIHGLIEEQYKNGLSGTRSNEIAATAIARKAVEKLDTRYLDILDQIPSGPDGKSRLSQVGYVRDLKNKTAASIFNQIHDNDEQNAKAHALEDKVAVRSLQTQTFLTLLNSPRADIKGYQKQLAELDPEKAKQLTEWASGEIKRKEDVEDDDSAVTLTHDVFSGNGDPDAVIAAHKNGHISKATATHLMENIERSEEFRATLRNPTLQELHRSLGTVISGSGSQWDTPENRQKSEKAQNAFLEAMTNYKKANPKASETDLIKEGRTLQNELVQVYADPNTTKRVNDSTPDQPLTPTIVLLSPPEKTDWKSKFIFANPEQFDQAVQEFNKTKGKGGVLKDMATHLGIPEADLYKAQMAASKAKPKP